jgi:hypothetical protein
MSEYELYEVVVGFTGNLEQSMAVLISLLSAYLVLAYAVGQKLTTFQVLFISICFTVAYIGVMQAQIFYLDETLQLAGRLEALRAQGSIAQGTGEVSMVVFIAIRFLFLVGALYFMWNVRHTKVE